MKRQGLEFWEVKAVKFTRQKSAAQRKRKLQPYPKLRRRRIARKMRCPRRRLQSLRRRRSLR